MRYPRRTAYQEVPTCIHLLWRQVPAESLVWPDLAPYILDCELIVLLRWARASDLILLKDQLVLGQDSLKEAESTMLQHRQEEVLYIHTNMSNTMKNLHWFERYEWRSLLHLKFSLRSSTICWLIYAVLSVIISESNYDLIKRDRYDVTS